MAYRFGIAVGLSAVIVPALIPAVQTASDFILRTHNLAWINPGNAAGILLSYTAAGFAVTAIASASRRVHGFQPREVLWWGGAITLICTSFVVVRWGVSAYANPELGLLAAVATAGVGIIQVTRTKFPEYAFDTHVRGPRLRTSKNIKQARGGYVPGFLPWGADYIDCGDENEHFLLWGNIGGGKTQFLKMMMAAVGHRENQLWIVFDPKPEFVPYLESLGREVLIFNPLDQRRVAWDVAQDIDDETTATTFVEILIPTQKGIEDYWAKAAQNILVSILIFLIRSRHSWTLRDVLLIAFNPEDLKRVVGHDKLNAIIAEGLQGKNERSGTNDYMLTLNNYLRRYWPIAALMHSAKTTISLKDLIENERYGKKAIVLGSDEKSRSTIKTFNALVFENLINFYLDLPDDRKRRVWVWVDEMSEASRFLGRNLVRFMTKVRSKGGCCVLAAQNRAGLVKSFEKEDADQIIELCKRKAVVGGIDGESAKHAAEVQFGEAKVVQVRFGQQKEYDGTERELTEGSGHHTEHESSLSYDVGSQPLVTKEELHSSSFPKTGPENGLTGFFFGSVGGPHWHTYPWREVKDMQVEDAPDIAAYERIKRGDTEESDWVLQPWSEAERERWGLPLIEPDDSTEGNEDKAENENPLHVKYDNQYGTLSREDALQILPISDRELDELTDRCGFGTQVEQFSRDEFLQVLAQIGIQLLDIDFEWMEDEP